MSALFDFETVPDTLALVLVRFGDGTDKYIEVGKVLWVEVSFNDEECNLLVLDTGREMLGYIDKAEVRKVERHKIDIFEDSNITTLKARDAARRFESRWEKVLKWIRESKKQFALTLLCITAN